MLSSSIFGSTMMNRTSSGVAFSNMLNNMAFTPTDLPEPVVPATSRWGILARLATMGLPPISFPRANVSGEEDSVNTLAPSTSLRRTISRSSLGISMPTTDLPGITSTTRTLSTARDRARSFARLEILLTLTPGAGLISKRVITGPGLTSTTSTDTPKSLSFSSSKRDMCSRDSSE